MARENKRAKMPTVAPVGFDSEVIAQLVSLSLDKSAFVGFSRTRSGSVSVTVMLDDDKERFYVERQDDWQPLLDTVTDWLVG